MLEHDLKAAMTAETAALTIAPDLAERVERRARRGRWRTRLAALLAAVLAAAGWWLVPNLLGTPAARPDRMIDGVELGHLPAGLVRQPDLRQAEGEVTITTARWIHLAGESRLERSVNVSVARGPIATTEAWRVYSGEDELDAVVAGHPGTRMRSPHGEFFYWAPAPDLAITVMTMGEVSLEAVVAGLDY
ncbi:hypothetical protein [Herbidospora daliensis]|uniref:hypothetical protein n=1 Tax=Herbidospora daliensis TaxID=295585 RepID=UPI000783EBA7|nr:hypothetical protein [Herbidospora daliensis]